MKVSFGDNLKLIRKERGITQEQLAEMLEVTRQAVSRWESDNGYPETDKLLTIAKRLDVSLDYLMDNKPADPTEKEESVVIYPKNDKILITMFDGNQTVNCISVRYNKIMFPAKNEPSYILQGTDRVGFFGAHTVILGWYEEESSVKKEMEEIVKSIENGEVTYSLKYYTDIEFKGILGIANRK